MLILPGFASNLLCAVTTKTIKEEPVKSIVSFCVLLYKHISLLFTYSRAFYAGIPVY